MSEMTYDERAELVDTLVEAGVPVAFAPGEIMVAGVSYPAKQNTDASS